MTTPLIYNPLAGRGKLAALVRTASSRLPIRPVTAASPRETRQLAARLAADYPRLLVAGGDGTVHHTIRGVAGSAATLGIVPCGTGNDFAHALGVPTDFTAAVRQGLERPGRPVDLGFADDRAFAGIAGVGIVADVLTYLDRFTRRFRGNWIYPWALVRTIASYRPIALTIESAEGGYEGRVMIALAANISRFGGGMRAAPDARFDDGLLDIVLLEHTGPIGTLRLLPRVYRGTHLADRRCHTFRTTRAQFRTAPGTVFYADGERLCESAGTTIVRIEPGALFVAA